MTSVRTSGERAGGRNTIPPAETQHSLPLFILQLLLVLWVVRGFQLEERRGLFALLLLATAGTLIHSRLAPHLRPIFFLILSLASFPLAFAWPLLTDAGISTALATGCHHAAWVFALGSVLIGVCHLPLAWRTRAFLLGGLVTCMAVWRWPAVSPFWAVLGSIFMFRLWIYFNALRYDTEPSPWTQRLSYFFLFSNGFFPFFPIIDFRKFRDGYRGDDEGALRQRGVAWIFRGVIHLLLYRTIKTFWLPGQADLIDAEYLALFLVTNYALYLRISGHFHIITGLLHLFGYALPRTHDRYFLASSFSDIWRRINIYWKDFLADHIFFPIYFSLARFPKSAAIVVGVLATFVATWLLHSWQVFWLLGDFPIGFRDAALWLSAGTLVAINSLWQYRRALRPTAKPDANTIANAFRFSVQVAATFFTVSFFWACWTVPSFPQQVVAVATSGGFAKEQLMTLTGLLLGLLAVGTATQLLVAYLRQRGIEPVFPLERSPLLCVAALSLLACAATPGVHQAFGPRLAALTVETPAVASLENQARGYYESLAEVNLQADPLLDRPHRGREGTAGDYWEGTRLRGDALGTELIPNWRGLVRGVPAHFNRWGMRDDDLPRRKPPGTYRIAVLGSSVTMGYGVAANADFESLLEQRLNQAIPLDGPRVELLNFAVGGYFALHSALALREKAFPFDPDAVFYIAHQGELYGPPRHLGPIFKAGHPLPYPCLDMIIRSAGVTAETSWGSTELLLQRHASAIVACVYRGIVEDCHRRGILPIWIYLPIPGIQRLSVDPDQMLQLGRAAGFTVIDLSDWAAGYEPHEVKFTATDFHANEFGHQLIAERLYQQLRANPVTAPLLTPEPSRP